MEIYLSASYKIQETPVFVELLEKFKGKNITYSAKGQKYDPFKIKKADKILIVPPMGNIDGDIFVGKGNYGEYHENLNIPCEIYDHTTGKIHCVETVEVYDQTDFQTRFGKVIYKNPGIDIDMYILNL